MRERCLCLFLKFPEPGRVKTRLAADLGDEKAVEIYRRMVCEVVQQAKRGGTDRIVFCYTPDDKAERIKSWVHPLVAAFEGSVDFLPQCDGDLGDRLIDATEKLFREKSDRNVIIIGTDCIELDRKLLRNAWDKLDDDSCDVIIGPSSDGGYYLIGMCEANLEIFREIPWSSEKTCEETLRKITGSSLDYFKLPEKTDIDTFNEYKSFQTRLMDQPCVFFDRDGVINQSPGEGYVLKPQDFHLNEGIVDSLRVVSEAGYRAIVITSQKGVGKGLMSAETLDEIHCKMQSELSAHGLSYEGIYAYTGTSDCPHKPKPDPEMIDTAITDFFIDRSRSWMIGDADRDIAMGKNAKLQGTIRVLGEKPQTIEADYTIFSNRELPELLRKVL